MDYECEEEERFSTPLHIAASCRDAPELSRLLSTSHEYINTRDPWHHTPLHVSVQNSDLPSVKLLLSHGADPSLEVPDPYGYYVDGSNSLSLAASFGYVEVLRVLIEAGGPVTSKVLGMAVEGGRLECAKEVLTWVMKGNGRVFDDGVARDEGVGYALRIAAANWRTEIIEVMLRHCKPSRSVMDIALLEALVDIERYDDFHVINPVSRGTVHGMKQRVLTVTLLLDAGADVNTREKLYEYEGIPLLHQIVRIASGAEQAFMANIIGVMIGARSDVDTRGQQLAGIEDLCQNVRMGGREIFALFLERGSDVNSTDGGGRTPLFQAILADDVYFAQHLIEKGAAIAHSNNDGLTPLHVSASNVTPACSAIISLLLDSGASPSARTPQGETPLDYASHYGNAAAVKILLPITPTSIDDKNSMD
ncbi:uncharacterized protein BP5553_04559 [Venustampulla echinocandica]|uniref:Uncharacterized protein n=1 Tax=Venustampulla echinocandica TaxID=2656787 RepID=A0A370TNM1_9HELO|nr:uncharacterized protein BP5553_04559 [Venustampulla echinocandica]RDL37126.1 hypothetical protein BP5553_04559 [Venustampulla echinocandica]